MTALGIDDENVIREAMANIKETWLELFEVVTDIDPNKPLK